MFLFETQASTDQCIFFQSTFSIYRDVTQINFSHYGTAVESNRTHAMPLAKSLEAASCCPTRKMETLLSREINRNDGQRSTSVASGCLSLAQLDYSDFISLH